MDVLEILKAYSADVDLEIEEALSTLEPDELKDASAHLIKAGGKKFRPALTVLSCQAVGGETGRRGGHRLEEATARRCRRRSKLCDAVNAGLRSDRAAMLARPTRAIRKVTMLS